MNSPVVERFWPATREWFTGTFGAPTPAQEGAWEAISEGQHTLVVAPTGSGKTLSAFLWGLDQVMHAGDDAQPDADHRCRVLYVSPMKALAVDVERNLRSPLVGIRHAATRLGLSEPEVSVAVRSGDTTPKQRRDFASKGADVLITTPESLFLLLTSNARERLKGVQYVIIDEIHAVAGTKRGAHLAVTLERLDELLDSPAQRIGLSATVRPISEVERYLAGGRPVTTVAPPITKTWELDVVVPVEDMADLASSPRDDDASFDDHAPERTASIWPHVEERIVDLIAAHTSTLVFANSRRLAERLTARLNEIWAERLDAAAQAEALGSSAGADDIDLDEADLNDDDAIDADADKPAQASSSSLVDPWATGPVGDAMTGAARADEARAGDGRATRDEVMPGYDARASTPPAALIGGAGTSAGTPAVIARAHHGSVSKDVRAEIEGQLKAGRLPAVVATSSLELGIDMGAIDLVVQVESPPSVASGLQRIGRAGHQVGATSHGVLFPKYRGDLLSAAVVVDRMRRGLIESIAVPANPLDVLAQQVVAMVAMDEWRRDDLERVLRRAASFAGLTGSVLDSVLDMLSGLYPSDTFRELRARIVWDRSDDVLRSRPGAQRLAVTSGGTIPDRGLYGVFLAGGDGPGRRVGELDEEMVYESRVGDVFTLGTSTWRIEDITRDQVLVTPAPGQVARLPFWKGDALSRPLELGEAIGAFTREMAETSDDDALTRARELGLDELAARNLLTYLREQQEAVGHMPTDRTVVIERFRDEMGDWRIVVHSPFGASVHAPWALAVSARMAERFGVEVQAMHTDDGLVFRLLETEGDDDTLTNALIEAIVLDPDDVADIVTHQVGGTPLFAARFRECAARALLLPRGNPGKRQALWQQRQRAAQLLEVASAYPSFPIVLEAVREVLQDVYDVPGLVNLMRSIAKREVRVVHTQTTSPSPYAKAMLFSYVAQFLYEGDSPLAERRAAALSLDPELLADLLGSAGGLSVADLLDPDIVRLFESRTQRLAPDRRLRHAEDLADALRALGPLTLEEIAARAVPASTSSADPVVSQAESSGPAPTAAGELAETGDDAVEATSTDVTADDVGSDAADHESELDPPPGAEARDVEPWWRELVAARRAIEVRWGGDVRLAAIEDASRLRDALGVALPPGAAQAYLEPVTAPLDDLLLRYAASHAPFTAARAARHYGLGVAVVTSALTRLAHDSRLVHGALLPDSLGGGDRDGEFCDPGVLRTLRRMSLASLRAEIEPVAAEQYARFLPRWQQVGGGLRGPDGVLAALEPLVGVPLPASAIESLILPARVTNYRPSDLDELLAAGELLWQGHGSISADDGWISFHFPDTAPLTLAAHALPSELDAPGREAPAEERSTAAAASSEIARSGAARSDAEPDAQTSDAAASGVVDNTDDADVNGSGVSEPPADQLAEVAGAAAPMTADSGAHGATAESRDDRTAAPTQTGTQKGRSPLTGGAVARALGVGGSHLFADLRTRLATADDSALTSALWDAVWNGHVSGDTFAPVRALLTGGASAHKPRVSTARGSRYARLRGPSLSSRAGRPSAAAAGRTPPTAVGRWRLLPAAEDDLTERTFTRAEGLLARHGIVTRGAVVDEDVVGGFAAVYKVLAGAEERGLVRRGYFVEGLGASQFGASVAVDALRATRAPEPDPWGSRPVECLVLAACDPANPFGAALPWPPARDEHAGHRPGRKAGALVVIADGALVAYVERGGRTALTWTAEDAVWPEVGARLAGLVSGGQVDSLSIKTVNGISALTSEEPIVKALMDAGFVAGPHGIRKRR